ncbi:MAG: hypothetical protein AAF798_10420 [Bacteroidota bacterium]
MMKNLKYFLFLCLAGSLFVACEYDSFEEEGALSGIEGTEQNPFVRLDNTLQGSASVDEGDGTLGITVENLFPTETDVTVAYELGGTATFGEDYTIAGATATGGTIDIIWDADAFGIALEDIVIEVIDDCAVETGETITIALTSATAANGRAYDVGQGSLHREVTVSLGDVEPVVGFNAEGSVVTDTLNMDTVAINVVVSDFNDGCDDIELSVEVDDASTADAADYELLTTEILFDGSGLAVPIEVIINADAVNEMEETIILNIQKVSSGSSSIGTGQHTITIRDLE